MWCTGIHIFQSRVLHLRTFLHSQLVFGLSVSHSILYLTFEVCLRHTPYFVTTQGLCKRYSVLQFPSTKRVRTLLGHFSLARCPGKKSTDYSWASGDIDPIYTTVAILHLWMDARNEFYPLRTQSFSDLIMRTLIGVRLHNFNIQNILSVTLPSVVSDTSDCSMNCSISIKQSFWEVGVKNQTYSGTRSIQYFRPFTVQFFFSFFFFPFLPITLIPLLDL